MKLYSYTKGNSTNPAVLLLHGLLGSSRNLFRVAEQIAEAGFFVVAYDQSGHGHSDHSEHYSLSDLAGDVFRVMNEHQIGKAHLVGHSLGARVSLAATNSDPTRVLSLTMLDAGIKINPNAVYDLRQIIEPLPESFNSKADAERFLSNHSVMMRQFLMANLRTRDGKQTWVFDLPKIRDELLTSLAEDQTPAWKNVGCPVLVARGAISRHFTQDELEHMLSLQPHAQAASIANAAHWVHVDNFEDTVQIITAFLKKVTNR